MATEIREFSTDEVSSVIPSFQKFGVTSDIQGQPLGQIATPQKPPARTISSAPVNTMQLPPIVGASINTPAAGGAQMPDVQAVTDAVNQTNQNIQTNLPPPVPGSASQVLGNEVKQIGSSLSDTLMKNWQIPVFALGLYGAYKLLGEGGGGGNPPDGGPPNNPPPKKLSMRDRMLLGDVKEPTGDPFAMAPANQPAPAPEAPPKPMLSQQDMDLIRQSEANKAAKEAEAAAKAATQNKPLSSQSGFVGPESPFQGPKLPEFIGPPESPFVGPKLPPFVGPPESDIHGPPKPIVPPKTPQAETPAAISPETEKPAAKKRGRKSAEEKAAIAAAVPPSEAGLNKQQLGMKKYLESFYGGGDVGAKTYESIKDILGYTPAFPEGKGGGLNAEENAKVKGYRKENIPGPKVNLTHDMKKALKAGGGAAVLAAIPGFAEAKNAREFFGNVAEALLPIGVTPSELASGKLTPEIIAAQNEFMKERQKLGSPYRSVPPPR